jgi:hypothetical protein
MLIQLEEMLSFNFTVFSEAELELMPLWLSPLRDMADLQTHSARFPRAGTKVRNPHYKPGREKIADQIVKRIHNMFLEINQALFLYLKGALHRSPNLEIESDKTKVEGYLVSLGFNEVMAKTLDAAERLYRSAADGFELKSCLGHLRTFYEELHMQVATAMAETAGTTPPTKFGVALSFLRQQTFFTEKEEKFSGGLYGLISDEAVHSMMAGREYARLMRNMVIEFGLVFLTIMEKRDIKVGASNSKTAVETQPGSVSSSIRP